MAEVVNRFVAVLDANVLFSFRVKDVLLTFAELGLYRARWTQQILDEWTENLVEQKPELEDRIRSQQLAMENAFPESVVEGYEAIAVGLALPDPNDNHVLAATIRCGAQLIVTENLKDFPANVLAQYDIEARSADDFLSSTFELFPRDSLAALRTVRRGYDNPAMNPSEFIMDLRRVKLVKLAALARTEIDAL
jgi:hypothetical protein